MDQLSVSPEVAEGLKNLSAQDRIQLNQFVQNESQKAQIQSSRSARSRTRAHVLISMPLAIHSLTDMCFRKCITSKISAGSLDRYEEPCMRNCVDRFMDSQMLVVRNLEKMQR
ncbi:hypothetical protein BT93_L0148 [Corymbia citriodora subsp. variegata]|uniref:Mitochondrial import inner membrane translocase subunit n=1 Tax=Corymbia citriodora subsp. variegata TaxID=360336 RepID=A0A8T0CFR1_CORYI|nr:hypothetical protein BT93_L0148 [Corymbia citriodora subsp. variegata]